MKIKNILVPVLLTALLSSTAFPQTQSDSSTGKHHRGHSHFRMWEKELHGSSTISFNYGFSQMSLKDLSAGFEDPNMLELKIGYTSLKDSWGSEDIFRYNYRYLVVSNFSNKLAGNSNENQGLKSSLWRIGFGRSTGFGYKIGSSAIIPYYTYSVDWSKLNMEDTPKSVSDQKLLSLYDGTFRFGTGFEGGIRFQVIKPLTVEAAYQRMIIFRRHLFWKWLGSIAIESAGQWLIDEFVDEVMDSSPYAVPVVNFVLKNALAFGAYQLRKDKMNWPFDSEPPLSYNQFKVGLTFVF